MHYQSRFQSEEMERLFEAVLLLENKEECYRFFEDICTAAELTALAQRMQIALLLRDGETYQAIAQKTGASTATISRVNRCIGYGAGGYQLIFERLEDQ